MREQSALISRNSLLPDRSGHTPMISARWLLQGSKGSGRGLNGIYAGTYQLTAVSSLLIPCSFMALQTCIIGARVVRADFR